MTIDIKNYQQVLARLGYANEDGAMLLLRIQLLAELKTELESRNISQAQAARLLDVKQPRISEIYNLRIDKFSLELLVRYLYRLKKEVGLNVSDLDT